MAENVRRNETGAQAVQVLTPEGKAATGGRRRGLASLLSSPLFIGVVIILIGVGGYFGFRYWQDQETKIYIDSSEISAPVISIGPEIPGVLKAVYVKEGEHVTVGEQLFNVGDRVISSPVPGIVTSVQNTPGQWASNQNAIVQMYNPGSLRVVGHLQEDQGLSDVRVGQQVMFTVDAFDAKQFAGTVESIGKTADATGAVFSISDKRPEKQYDIKVAFDPNAYPEILNGMSARMWIYK